MEVVDDFWLESDELELVDALELSPFFDVVEPLLAVAELSDLESEDVAAAELEPRESVT